MAEESKDADVIIMAAAVADYRPAIVAESKMKRARLATPSPHSSSWKTPMS